MSSLPYQLSQAIEQEVSKIDFSVFSQAINTLSLRYRSHEKIFITSLAERLAYIGVRLPGTYSAIWATLSELKTKFPDIEFSSLLDLGAGPGTTLWAALTVWPEISNITLVERDKETIALGQKLASNSTNPFINSAQWLNLDLVSKQTFLQHDLVVISYALGEMESITQQNVLLQAWQATKEVLIIIEPGTVKGFNNILLARDFLISSDANILAPCPHKQTCPIAKNDWCHFSERVERSSFHRRAKAGTLSYEDEKFSYIIAAKNVIGNSYPRIIRHPLKRPGHIHLDLCTNNGLSRVTISQKNKKAYKLARKLSWGNTWLEKPNEELD